MSFDRWDLSIHNNPEQLKRRISASKIKPSDIKLDEIHSSAIICGSGEEPYSVTLDSCICFVFQSRDLPRKHMYRLALELGCLENLPEVDPDAEKDFESRIMTIIDGYYHDLQEGAISADRFLKIASALLTGCSKKFPGSKRKPTQEFKESIPSRVELFENDFKSRAISADKFVKIASSLTDILK